VGGNPGSSSRRLLRWTLGTLTQSLARGRSATVTFKLSRSLTALFRRAGSLKIAFTVGITVPGGRAAKQTLTVTLKAPKKK
jgi:hypothetical protein